MWSVANKTDGVISDDEFDLIPDYDPESTPVLLEAGLLVRGQSWLLVDFEETQTSRKRLEATSRSRSRKREYDRNRMRAKRAEGKSADHKDSRNDVADDIADDIASESRHVSVGQDRTGACKRTDIPSEQPAKKKSTEAEVDYFAFGECTNCHGAQCLGPEARPGENPMWCGGCNDDTFGAQRWRDIAEEFGA
jgi:hypothetical protein